MYAGELIKRTIELSFNVSSEISPAASFAVAVSGFVILLTVREATARLALVN